MMRGPGVARLLERALVDTAARAGTAITVTGNRATEWHSATFSGMRHEIAGEATTDATLDRWLEGLSEAELSIAGHLVADIAVTSLSRNAAETAFVLEALTVAES